MADPLTLCDATKPSFMKSLLLLSFAILVLTSLKAQHFALTAYGGYNFRDKVEFHNAFGYINAGGLWAIGAEGVASNGAGAEVIFQNQVTHVPLYLYLAPNVKINPGNDKVGLSYLLFNFLGYINLGNPNVQPYGAIGVGIGFISPHNDYGSNSSKFAWDSKLGVKIKAQNGIGFKLQAQVMSITQAAGGTFYFGTGGAGTGVSSYSSIFQLGLVGGLTYDFPGGKH